MSEQRNSNTLPGSYHPLYLTDEVGPLSGKVLGDFGNAVTIEPVASDPAHSKSPLHKAFRLPTDSPSGDMPTSTSGDFTPDTSHIGGNYD